MPMAKYQAQYRTLTAQFGNERTIFYNDAHLTYGTSSQSQPQSRGISQGETGFAMKYEFMKLKCFSLNLHHKCNIFIPISQNCPRNKSRIEIKDND